MNDLLNNEKIEKYLDELSKEYRTLLFSAFISNAKSLDELSLSELLRLDTEIKKPLLDDYQKQQKQQKRWRLLFIVGVIYMFLGIATFLAEQIRSTDMINNPKAMIQIISVVLSLVGLLISIYSVAFYFMKPIVRNRIKDKNEESPILLEYEVVSKWRKIEGIVNDLSVDLNIKSPRSSLQFLIENKFIDNKENIVLKEFLKIRNDIVHSSNEVYSSKKIEEKLIEVNRIILKLEKSI